ncbi:MAG: glycosyltransferase family 4 protein [Anaerolineales bacterium]|jgi:glycosyltransferase involved in cell wall biosynthesis
MLLLFVVDGRSPIAENWMNYLLERDYEIHLVSSYPGNFDHRFASVSVIPVAFSNAVSGRGVGDRGIISGPKIFGGSAVKLRTYIRQWLGPLSLKTAAAKLSERIKEIKPDLIHAMRIPFEGMLLSLAETKALRLVSVWGNDFTLHAKSNPIMMKYTRQALLKMDGLHADCERDIRLAYQLGYKKSNPTIVLPGGGGVQLDIFYPAEKDFIDRLSDDRQEIHTVERGRGNKPRPRVINPRGYRAYVRNDIFFKAIPLVLAKNPDVEFFCPNMEDVPNAVKWINTLGISENVKLLPKLSRDQMANLFRSCSVCVSPSTHDGTPNTLLEAMASGCFPVIGDIESIREWIEPGVNGILFNPTDPEELASGILLAIENDNLCETARIKNLKMITERAEYQKVMKKVEGFYRELLGSRN